MKIESRRILSLAALAGCATLALSGSASAQSILFDFNNAPLHSPLPVSQTAGGITALLSATGQGFSIQDQSAPVFPQGFSGRYIYPSSINAADLLVSFDHTLTSFSILYAPDELGCDDSCTMRVTAYMNGTYVGTNTHTASNPGTYPVDTLSCSFPQGFNSVDVHYDSHPPTCQDYGVIFLADDMRVTPMVTLVTPFCFGDGTAAACPCSNSGAAGHGCANASNASGAQLSGSGTPSLSNETLHFTCTGQVPGSLSIVFAGDAAATPRHFGDGLRCVAGALRRLYVKSAVGGVSSAPEAGDPTIVARSAALGDALAIGTVRYYHVYYADPSASFCAPPSGSTFNISNALNVTWSN